MHDEHLTDKGASGASGHAEEGATAEGTGIGRPRAFIPHRSDEGPFDYLGFWNYGSYRGEWSGTSAWLADMPLPDCVIESVVTDMKSMPTVIANCRGAVAQGRTVPALLLAPVTTSDGHAVLPVQGHPYAADPNFVAHIERGIPGGEWMLTTDPVAKMAKDGHYAVLVYVVGGEAKALVAPIKHEAHA